MHPKNELLSVLGQLGDNFGFEEFSKQLNELIVRKSVSRFDDELEEVIEVSTGKTQSFACGFALQMGRSGRCADVAKRMIAANMSSGDTESRIWVAGILFLNRQGDERFIDPMRRLLLELPNDDNRRTWVAGTVLLSAIPGGKHADLRTEMMDVLLCSLRSNDAYAVLMSAIAFTRVGIHVKAAAARLVEICAVIRDDFREILVAQLVEGGGSEECIISCLSQIMCDLSERTSVRLAAIVASSNLTKMTSELHAALTTLLYSDDWNIFFNAIVAIRSITGRIDQAVFDALLARLNHENPNFRGIAARLLHATGCPSKAVAAKALLSRLDTETDESVLEVVMVAFEDVGSEAIAEIASRFETCDLGRFVYYQGALHQIGMKHPESVAELMSHENVRVRRAAAWVINTLGADAVPAIPVLIRHLEHASDEVVFDILVAMRPLGPAAELAVKSLGKLLTHKDRSICRWATDAILTMGPIAIPHLSLLAREVDDANRLEINEVIRRISCVALPNAGVQSVDGVIEEQLLERFVLMGEVLSVTGPLSFLKLEQAIVERHPDSSCSASTLRRTVDILEQQWSEFSGKEIVLIDRQRNAKGEMTKVGKRYLKRVQEFLEQVRTSRRPKD